MKARLRGRDLGFVSRVEFLVGRHLRASLTQAPFAVKLRLLRTAHERIYTVRARVRLADGRRRTLRRRVRMCTAR